MKNTKIEKKGARIMIAAPQSGSGKTLITCALLQALKEKNYHLESFKTPNHPPEITDATLPSA